MRKRSRREREVEEKEKQKHDKRLDPIKMPQPCKLVLLLGRGRRREDNGTNNESEPVELESDHNGVGQKVEEHTECVVGGASPQECVHIMVEVIRVVHTHEDSTDREDDGKGLFGSSIVPRVGVLAHGEKLPEVDERGRQLEAGVEERSVVVGKRVRREVERAARENGVHEPHQLETVVKSHNDIPDKVRDGKHEEVLDRGVAFVNVLLERLVSVNVVVQVRVCGERMDDGDSTDTPVDSLSFCELCCVALHVPLSDLMTCPLEEEEQEREGEEDVTIVKHGLCEKFIVADLLTRHSIGRLSPHGDVMQRIEQSARIEREGC